MHWQLVTAANFRLLETSRSDFYVGSSITILVIQNIVMISVATKCSAGGLLPVCCVKAVV